MPLPPNRTGGSSASGSPVGGFTCKRSADGATEAQEKVPEDRREAALSAEGHHGDELPRFGGPAPSMASRTHVWLSPKALGRGGIPDPPKFLIHLPASLRSWPITALRRSYGRSDSCSLRPGSARALPSGHPFGSTRTGLPDSPTRPSPLPSPVHQMTDVLSVSPRHVACRRNEPRLLPYGSPNLWELGASPLASRLATYHRSNPVSYRTDWPFTSCCSSTRVATTVAAATRLITSYVNSERTSTSRIVSALRRTGVGTLPASTEASRGNVPGSASGEAGYRE